MATTTLYQFSALAKVDHYLDLLPGAWQGTMRTWFEPGVLGAQAACRGSFRILPGAPVLLYEYESSLEERPFTGMALYGYNTHSGLMEAAWADSAHMSTALMFSQGPLLEHGFAVTGSYAGPGGGPPWGWRSELAIQDRNHITLHSYNISPAGEEALAIEKVFTRQ